MFQYTNEDFDINNLTQSELEDYQSILDSQKYHDELRLNSYMSTDEECPF